MPLEDNIEGTAKEAQGKVTGDHQREAGGALQQAEGKDTDEDVRDAAGNLIDRAKEKVAEHRHGDADKS